MGCPGRCRPSRYPPLRSNPAPPWPRTGAIVRPDMPGHAAQDEQVGQDIDDVGCFELASHPDGQALVGELVEDVQQPELAPVMAAVLDKIVAPDMVRPLRA